jgi:hypothetical protein
MIPETQIDECSSMKNVRSVREQKNLPFAISSQLERYRANLGEISVPEFSSTKSNPRELVGT